jgi:hypothetical protein
MSNISISRASYLISFHKGCLQLKEINAGTYVLFDKDDHIPEELAETMSEILATINEYKIYNNNNLELAQYQDAIFDFIQSRPLGVTNSELRDRFRKMPSSKIEKCKRNLERIGFIFMYKGKPGLKGGRPELRWFANPAYVVDNL